MKKERITNGKKARVAEREKKLVVNLDIEQKKEIFNDKNCPIHGNLKLRGKVFKGKVIKKFHKRVVIEFERMTYVRKYERYAKLKTKIHARLPICMEKEINIGDLIKIQECRPLSKMIHFVVMGKTNGNGEKK